MESRSSGFPLPFYAPINPGRLLGRIAKLVSAIHRNGLPLPLTGETWLSFTLPTPLGRRRHGPPTGGVGWWTVSAAAAAAALACSTFKSRPHTLVVLQLARAHAGHQLPMGVDKVLLHDHHGDVLRRRVVVEEVRRRDRVLRVLRARVDRLDLVVHLGCLPRDGLEHGVTAQGVEVGSCVGEWQSFGDTP